MNGVEALRDESIEWSVPRLMGWAIEHLFGGGVKLHDTVLLIYGDNGVHRRLHNGVKAILALAQRCSRLLPLFDWGLVIDRVRNRSDLCVDEGSCSTRHDSMTHGMIF